MSLLSPAVRSILRYESSVNLDKISRSVVTQEQLRDDAERLVSVAADALTDARRAVRLLTAAPPQAYSAAESALDTVAAAVELRDILTPAFVDAAAALVRRLRAQPEPDRQAVAIRALINAQYGVERVLDHIAVEQALDELREDGLSPAASGDA